MMETFSLLEQAIQQTLEMSADLQIKRMATTPYSLECHDYSVAIAAYGRVLRMLTMLQQQDECRPGLALLAALRTPRESRAVL